MKIGALIQISFLLASLAIAVPCVPALPKRVQKEPGSLLRISTGIGGCQVDIDGSAIGKTNSQGLLIIVRPEAGDHYVHADCPGKQEMTQFVSLPTGQKPASVELSATSPQGNLTPLGAAQNKIRLRHLVQQAVSSRAHGQFDEAVKLLREAALLDPSNSDLHRELGITFLLSKDWQRARIEMLEAIRHDPQDADAHNGLGYALEKLGDLKQALAEFHTATQLDPSDTSYREQYYEAMGRLAAQQAAEKKR